MSYGKVKEAKTFPIGDILRRVGSYPSRKTGGKIFYSSPFSSDSSPSFCVYPNNTFFDFSNGFGGDAVNLYMRLMNCKFSQAVTDLCSSTSLDDIEVYVKKKKKRKKQPSLFNPSNYICKDEGEIEAIREYAASRSIFSGYEPSKIVDYSTGEAVERLAMMYVHQDSELNICGAKFRFIEPEESRFTARGKLEFYILENIIDDHFSDPVLYFVESESSANSLWEIMKNHYINGIVLSIGGQANKFEEIPKQYQKYNERRIIIDYDDNEEQYEKILKLHQGWCKPIKLQLGKGEDINSLYNEGKESLIINSLI